MAAIATIASGHDPAYYTQAAKGPEYYSSAAGKSGMEPEGTWTGAGCRSWAWRSAPRSILRCSCPCSGSTRIPATGRAWAGRCPATGTGGLAMTRR